ncbi:hypothetical protein BVG16_23110 [Paenibacillus selenitireducens]|uniref:Uncharacterized protein n=1 Tax=Paenibacillus selenitireducens TaxID=1324314 RepID=A0A1T2X471_9BACL|nr:hypothetical protein [Paenibacillus selenitireducens]OPA74650.1 hypothetical protein BVG16_23110 [Paenibacillus selenitireducens]
MLGNHLRNMLWGSVSVVLFIVSLTISWDLSKDITKAIDHNYQYLSASDREITTTTMELTSPNVSRATILQSIADIRQVGVKLTVEGMSFDPSMDLDSWDVHAIHLKTAYQPSSIRDPEGNVIEVQYEAVEDRGDSQR